MSENTVRMILTILLMFFHVKGAVADLAEHQSARTFCEEVVWQLEAQSSVVPQEMTSPMIILIENYHSELDDDWIDIAVNKDDPKGVLAISQGFDPSNLEIMICTIQVTPNTNFCDFGLVREGQPTEILSFEMSVELINPGVCGG